MEIPEPTSSTSTRRGFTLIELLVVVLIVAVLSGIGFFSMRRIQDSARRTVSMSNLRQIGIGLMSFAVDNNGYLPLARKTGTTGYWPELLYPFLGSSTSVFLRPGTPNVPMNPSQTEGYFDVPPSYAQTPEGLPIRWNYTINGGDPKLPFSEDPKNNAQYASGLARPLSSIDQPERTVFMAEGTSWWLNAEAKNNSSRIYRWKNGTSNILFGDGSVRNLNPKSKQELPDSYFLAKKP